MKKYVLTSIVLGLILTGCSPKGNDLGGDVYDSNALNSLQNTKVITILDVLPAKVAVDNSDNKRTAQTVGTVIGAATGAIIGYNAGKSSNVGAGAGGAIGGSLGNVAGGMVSDKKIVEGVTIVYKDGNKRLSSTQAGKMCAFRPGNAVMIITSRRETRVQANSICGNSKKNY